MLKKRQNIGNKPKIYSKYKIIFCLYEFKKNKNPILKMFLPNNKKHPRLTRVLIGG